MGNSEDVIRKTVDEGDEDEEDDRVTAEKIAMAQNFDVKLVQEVSRGAVIMVDFTKKLGGWEAAMLHEHLQSAQYSEAIMTLPRSHPARRALLREMWNSFARR
jgi:hypothetical protein